MKLRRILTLCLVLCMFALLPTVANAAIEDSGTCGENLTWTLDDSGTLTISGEGEMTSNWGYTGPPWWSKKDDITTIMIADGVTSISGSAFDGCGNVTKVTIADSVTSIGMGAFNGCGSLTRIKLPEHLTTIEQYAFMYCVALEEIKIPARVTDIGAYAFMECWQLRSVTLPEGLKRIGYSAFRNCESLKELTIPASVTSMEMFAASFCGNLESITFQGDAPAIESPVFEGVTATAYYPRNNATWAEEEMQNFGGNITWVSYEKAELNITAQPENVYAKIGTNVAFTVEAEGEELTYQWQYRSSATGTWKATSQTGNKTATLTIPATVSRNGYQYRCIVTDGAGNKVESAGASLSVFGIKNQPSDKTVSVGTATEFTVAVIGDGLTYQWQYRSSATGSWKTTTLTGAKTAILKVTAATVRNGYQYRCKITDRSGKVLYTDAATLTVVSGLTITSQPKSVTAKLNDAVSFTVKASGTGLTYQWQWRKNSASSWATTTVSGNKTATISVSATAARNGYQYRCVVKDANGKTVTSNGATLTVEIPLVINTQPENVTANIGDAVSFTVKASGNGLTYQWQYRTSATGTWKNTTLSGAKTATLKATATTARNGFQYRCVVTDSAGEVVNSNAVTLTVK